MGFTQREIEESLTQNKYDDVTATYLLLGRKGSEVGGFVSVILLVYYFDKEEKATERLPTTHLYQSTVLHILRQCG